LLVVLALVLAAVSYVNTLGFAFVYDDLPQLVNNPRVHTWEHAPRLFVEQVWTQSMLQGTGNYYRPIFELWLLIQYNLFGLHPWAYHLASVLMHMAVVGLAYLLFQRLTGDRLTASMGTVIFAVHPTHIESVAWISGVTDPLCALFVLGSFLAYMRARDAGSSTGDRIAWQVAALALYALAMMSKETAIVVPALLVVYEWLVVKRDSLVAQARRVTPFVVITGAYLLVRHWVLLGFMHPEAYSLKSILLTLPRVLWFYTHELVWPVGLSVFYDTPFVVRPGLWNFYLPLAGVVVFAVAVAGLARRSRPAAFGAGWMLAMLAPALVGMYVFIPEELAHDRYLYLPSIGFALIVAVALRQLSSKGELFGGPRLQVAAALALGGILAAGTAVQNIYWTNDLILYAHGVSVAPRNVVAIDHLANEFYKRKKPGAALALYRQALEIKPQQWQTHFAIGITLYELGDYPQATHELEEGIRVAPENAEQYIFLGLSQLSLSNYARAEQEFRRAKQLNSRRPGLNRFLATALLKQGKVEEAKDALRAEVSLTQDRSAAEELEKLQRQ
jgi:tetratricopeptide (TPR) repeat protein